MLPLEEVLAGPPLRKLLFMTNPDAVEGHLKPHWSAALQGSEAETMQAVPDMLGGWLGAGLTGGLGGAAACRGSRYAHLAHRLCFLRQHLSITSKTKQLSLLGAMQHPPVPNHAKLARLSRTSQYVCTPVQRWCPLAGTSGARCSTCWKTWGCRHLTWLLSGTAATTSASWRVLAWEWRWATLWQTSRLLHAWWWLTTIRTAWPRPLSASFSDRPLLWSHDTARTGGAARRNLSLP